MEKNQITELKAAIKIHQSMMEYRDSRYMNMIQQINTKTKEILTDDMGSQFLQNCGRDIAGEVVRNFFDTSAYNITVDQLAMRILKFKYDDDYDPLAENGGVGEVRKSVLNYNELQSAELETIANDLAEHQKKLFPEERSYKDTKAQKQYRESMRDENRNLVDELTGKEETHRTYQKNGKEVSATELQSDHLQSRNAATFDSIYLTDLGREELREFYNSADNMQLIHASANASKGDVRVYDKDGNDITYKATPEQLAAATVARWEEPTPSSAKRQKLIEQGYLIEEENGNVHVPKSVHKKLEAYIRHSQNEESKVILRNTKYGEVAKDAVKHTKSAVGKIIAGQIIYYAAPPLVYEVRTLLNNKNAKLDEVLRKLSEAGKRIGEYIASKLKDIFDNILFNSLKKFIKSFMDILINVVKATVKKLLKIAKNLVLATVDAVRIIADKNSTAAEKSDSVFNLFGVTITTCAIEIIFELIEKATKIPEWMLMPLQILTTVVCTNLTMLILQKMDLFDVRFGFKVNSIREIFADERQLYQNDINVAEEYSIRRIDAVIESAKKQSLQIYYDLREFDPKKKSVRKQLDTMNKLFSMNIDFEAEWIKFLGIDSSLFA